MGIFGTTMNILLMILGFGLLIFVHELGHFLAAKWAKIRTEGFAIGMGPVLFAWRKGIGFRLGSTEREYIRRAEAHMRASGQAVELTRERVYDAADEIGLGETEYSLRILPIGGFVKMLGQEDANPAAVSNDPRSYNRCPVGKRMVVVSAGVMMNLILAALLFMVIFSIGVPFDAPVVGDVVPGSPAAIATARNEQILRERGSEPTGLRPADRVLSIDGNATETFPDIQIASAMSKPGKALRFLVERDGFDEPLEYDIEPREDRLSGLRTVGIIPPSSATIESELFQEEIRQRLEEAGLFKQGVVPGSTIVRANGKPISIIQQLHVVADASRGQPVATEWQTPDGEIVSVDLPVVAELQTLTSPDRADDGQRDFEFGLLGLVPPTRISDVAADSPNRDLVRAGDIVARVDDIDWPRRAQLTGALRAHAGKDVQMRVLRDGTYHDLTVKVRRDGTMGVMIQYVLDAPIVARPMSAVGVPNQDEPGTWTSRATPAATADILPGDEVIMVGPHVVSDWSSLRVGLQEQTRDAFERGDGATIELQLRAPNKDRDQQTVTIALTAEDVQDLHALGWDVEIPTEVFARVMTVRSSNGNPVQALVMGVEETWKIMIQTYQTIDRLFRGTIGVDQLRGPVGIVHLGYQLADRGLLYMLFLLAAVSVNLAVINFLPLPIVDGGLFLFLIYEKIKGTPPSIAFQNMTTLVGLGLIISVFLFVTWNDVIRILG